jgi:hypothetical protein
MPRRYRYEFEFLLLTTEEYFVALLIATLTPLAIFLDIANGGEEGNRATVIMEAIPTFLNLVNRQYEMGR